MENKITQRIAGKAVIVNNEGKVLILRESQEYKGGTNIGKYGFPGGKVEPGESLQEALIRESKEECGLEIEVGEPFFVSEWRPEINGDKFQIFGVYFKCVPKNSDIVLGTDFDDYKWVDPRDCRDYDIMSPNEDVIKQLQG
ncbi:MAG: NUDIX domain-containing protein [Candidatus Pacebacteria bacterium]|nr:NUDIX domain-containing protein [Candidatus Paceibacterota bacterium]